MTLSAYIAPVEALVNELAERGRHRDYVADQWAQHLREDLKDLKLMAITRSDAAIPNGREK